MNFNEADILDAIEKHENEGERERLRTMFYEIKLLEEKLMSVFSGKQKINFAASPAGTDRTEVK